MVSKWSTAALESSEELVGGMKNSWFVTLAVLLLWGRVHDTTYLEP